MLTSKQTASSRISYKRKGRTYSLTIEGRAALLVLVVIAITYMGDLLH